MLSSRSKSTRLPASSLSRVDGPPSESESNPDITGTPFVRAPSRKKAPTLERDERSERPKIQQHDTYDWDDASHLVDRSPAPDERADAKAREGQSPSTKVAVGVSRLHQVEMPDLKMTPIYWTPVGDIAEVVRTCAAQAGSP